MYYALTNSPLISLILNQLTLTFIITTEFGGRKQVGIEKRIIRLKATWGGNILQWKSSEKNRQNKTFGLGLAVSLRWFTVISGNSAKASGAQSLMGVNPRWQLWMPQRPSKRVTQRWWGLWWTWRHGAFLKALISKFWNLVIPVVTLLTLILCAFVLGSPIKSTCVC